LLNGVLEDHVTKEEYDTYVKEQLDTIIENYDKLPDETKSEVLSNVVEDLKNSGSLDYQDKNAIKELENAINSGETPNVDVVTNVKDNMEKEVSKDDEDYSKVVSEDIKNSTSDLMDVLTKDTSETAEVEKAIENAINIADANKDNLTDEEQNRLNEIMSSYEEKGTLTDKEVVDLKDILDSVLEDNVTKEEYDAYTKEQLDAIIDNYDKLDDSVKSDILSNTIEDLKNSDNLDYQDKNAIKEIENAISKGETPSKDIVSNVQESLGNDISKDDGSYNEVLTTDVKSASSDLLDVITSKTSDKLEVEKAVENAINIADANKSDLTNEQQKALETLQASYEKNGSLTNKEVVELMDVLDAIYENNATKAEYDAYVKDQFDTILDNYDNIPSDVKSDILNNVVEDLKNSDNLDYQDKNAIKEIENVLDKGETPSKDLVSNVKDNLDNEISTTDKDYDKVVSNDAEEAIDDLMAVLYKDTTNKLEVEKAIENALNIANANNSDLSSSEKKELETLQASYDKNATLTNSETSQLVSLLNSIVKNHLSTASYNSYAKSRLNKVITSYNKLSDTSKKAILLDLMNELSEIEDLDYQDKNAINEVIAIIEDGDVPTKEQVTSVKTNLETTTSSSISSYDSTVSNDVKTSEKELLNVLTKNTTSKAKSKKAAANALNIVTANKSNLSDAEKKELETLQSSYDKNGTLTDSEIVELMDLLDSVLEDHSTKSNYDAFVNTKLDIILENYDNIDDSIKKELLQDVIEDVENLDNLDYKDKQAIKQISKALKKGNVPTKANVANLIDNLDETMSSENKNYDSLLSSDLKNSQNDVFNILTSTTTDKDTISEVVENALNMLDDNRKDLSSAEKKELDALITSFEKNGTLSQSELQTLMEIQNSSLEEHITTDDYISHMNDMLDKIITNYDKLPSSVRNDLVENVTENMLNYSDKLSSEQKQTLNTIKQAIDAGQTISKDQLTSLKSTVNAVVNPVSTTTVTETAAASKNHNNAQTGDNTSIFGFVGLAFIGLMGMVGITFKNKKRKKDE
jgi:LPXTG-motif cell wall-anchored protein